jgi:hypothetical protein
MGGLFCVEIIFLSLNCRLMNKIKHIGKLVTTYSNWKPSDVAFIKSLEWSGQDLILGCLCQIREKNTAWPDETKKFFELSLSFKGVNDLQLKFDAGFQRILGFNIIDVSVDGLEGINFQVEDYEHGVIGFYCKEIEVMG